MQAFIDMCIVEMCKYDFMTLFLFCVFSCISLVNNQFNRMIILLNFDDCISVNSIRWIASTMSK